MKKPKDSKWTLTLNFERGDGKVYTKQISPKSTKMFMYVTFVAALWTTSAYIYFYQNGELEAEAIKGIKSLNQLVQPEDSKNSELGTKPVKMEALLPPEPEVAVLKSIKTTEVSDVEFALDDTDILVAEKTATLQMSLRKTNNKPEIEGKLAGILVLRDSASGSEYRVSSRPEFIPLAPEKKDVEVHGLYFRAKYRVQKKLIFNLPEHNTFDEVKAELIVVTKNGDFKTIEVQRKKEIGQKELKIGNSGAPATSIH